MNHADKNSKETEGMKIHFLGVQAAAAEVQDSLSAIRIRSW